MARNKLAIDDKMAREIADVYSRRSARVTAALFGISHQGVLTIVRRLGKKIRPRGLTLRQTTGDA